MEYYQKLRSFLVQSLRVWKILKKPSYKEYTTVAKVSLIGVLILGFIGFIFSIVLKLFLQ